MASPSSYRPAPGSIPTKPGVYRFRDGGDVHTGQLGHQPREQVERHHFAPYPIEQRERLRNEDTLSLPVGTPLEEVERQMIMRTLVKTKNNKTRAAELLGISLKTLHNKLNLYRERGLLYDDE